MIQGSGSEAIIIVTAVFLAISFITVCLRCYVRLRVVRAFGWDDGFMVMAMILDIGFAISGIMGALNGVGANLEFFRSHPHSFRRAMISWWIGQTFYIVTCVLAKLSITISLLRITVSKIHAWILHIVMAISIIVGLIFFFFTIFQCHPVQYLWDRTRIHGRCIDSDVLVGIVYMYSAMTALTDFTIGLLPIFIVWDLQMSRRPKVALAGILGLGCIASSAVIIRTPFIHYYKRRDFLQVSTQVAIWSNIEAGLGITAGSLTTLRPLVRMLRESTSSSSSRIRTRASRSRSRSHKSSSGHQKESLSFRDESTKLWTGSYNDDYHGITTTVIGRGSSRDGRRSSSNGSTGEEDGTNINGNNINMVALDSFKVERSFQISITRH